MKMLGAKAFWAVFRILFFFLNEFKKKGPDQGMKFRRTNKVGKFEVKKVISKSSEQKCRSCRDLSTLPLNKTCHLLSKLFNSKLQLTFLVLVLYAALPVRIVACCDLAIQSNIAKMIRSPIT